VAPRLARDGSLYDLMLNLEEQMMIKKLDKKNYIQEELIGLNTSSKKTQPFSKFPDLTNGEILPVSEWLFLRGF